MPNLIHSLDAASLTLVLENYFKVFDNNNFYSVHDCFAVPCYNVNFLISIIKAAYCTLYSKKYIY